MTKLELFIKEKEVSVTKMESDLGLPARSIQLHRGIPKKYINIVEDYLKENFGYEIIENVEVDIPEKGVVIKKMYNEGRIPDWHDGIARFRDPENGIWKRFKDWCIRDSVDKATGEIKKKITPGFEPATEEVFEDKIGKYTICVNGIKVYKFEKT